MLLQPISERRSALAFDPDHTVSEAHLTALLEAARWAPSAMNRQPWAFLVGHRDDATFKGIADTLSGNNQVWAPWASVLLVAMVDNESPEGVTDAGRAYELGLAMGQLGVQAQSMGLITHQMGGFDKVQLSGEFGIPGHLRPMAVMAIGVAGDAHALPERLRARHESVRVRKSIDDFTFTGAFAV